HPEPLRRPRHGLQTESRRGRIARRRSGGLNMELIDTSLPVLVLQMDHYGALGVMRSLGRLGVPVYGVHPTTSPAASFSKYCRKVFTLNVEAVPADRAVEALLNIADSIGRHPL